MMVALYVLRYLLHDPIQGILLSSSADLSLVEFSDSDWGSCAVTRKSMSGFYITLVAVLCPGRARKNLPSLYLQLRLSIRP